MAEEKEIQSGLTRRDFVKVSAFGVAGVGLGQTAFAAPPETGGEEEPNREEAPPFDGKTLLVTVEDIVESPRDDYGIVVLKDAKDRYLPIWVGRFEALAVRMGLNGDSTARPLTYDFVKTVLEAAKAVPKRVVITHLREMTFFAFVELKANGALQKLDTRPSDAIALAIRMKTPIFVAKDLMETQSITKEDLERLQPPIWA